MGDALAELNRLAVDAPLPPSLPRRNRPLATPLPLRRPRSRLANPATPRRHHHAALSAHRALGDAEGREGGGRAGGGGVRMIGRGWLLRSGWSGRG